MVWRMRGRGRFVLARRGGAAAALVSALLVVVVVGGCGDPATARNQDAGNVPVRDATTADVSSLPPDATSGDGFPPAISFDRTGATTVTARVFASLDPAG